MDWFCFLARFCFVGPQKILQFVIISHHSNRCWKSPSNHILLANFPRYPSVIMFLFALSFEIGGAGSEHRIHSLFEKALANEKLQKSVLLWRCYLEYEANISHNPSAARRIFFRAIHACPWYELCVHKLNFVNLFSALYYTLLFLIWKLFYCSRKC